MANIWTDDAKQRICDLIREGQSVAEIARLYGVGRSRIYQLIPSGFPMPKQVAKRPVFGSIRLEPGQIVKLAEWSKQHGLSQPEIIRRLIDGRVTVSGDDLQITP